MLQTPPPSALVFRGHIPALDAIRGLAIVMVTMFRFREGPTLDLPSKIGCHLLDQGHFGVDLFFVLSGFLITGILFDSKGERDYFRNFYARRTLRIFPLYYAVLVLTLVILPNVLPKGVSEFSEASPYALWLWFYGANFAQCWQQDWVLGPFNHFWSLAIEEHFYLVWPLIIYFLRRRHAIAVSAACIATGFAGRIVSLCLWPDTVLPTEVFTLCRLDALGTGALLALILRAPEGATWMRKWHRTSVILAGALVAVALGGKIVLKSAPLAQQIVYWSSLTPVAILCGGLIFEALHCQPGSLTNFVLKQRWLQVAGKYSYGWYVFQGLILYDFNRYVTNEMLLEWCGGVSVVALALRVLLGSMLSLLLAILSWHLFEKHFLAWKPKHQRPLLIERTTQTFAGDVAASSVSPTR